MADVATPSNFTTGMMDAEEQSFTWTIENFSLIRSFKSMIDSQKIYFSVGSKVGHLSKWSVYLQESTVDGKSWIGIYFNIHQPSASDPIWKNALAQMVFVMEDAVPFTRNTGPQEEAAFTRGVGYDKFISAESCPDRLVIKHIFKLHVPSRPIELCQPTLEALQVQFATQAKKDLLALLLTNPSPGQSIKLISNEKREFEVQQGILEMKSPVLKAMMKNDPLKANSGVIYFPDISSKGLEFILTFLSTGELHKDWSETKVIVELTNAAGKYRLEDLLKFLDASLGKVCMIENVLALFTLAHDYSLKKAGVELLKFIHEKGSSSPEVYSKIQNGNRLLYPFISENDIQAISKDKKESASSSNMKHVMPPSSFATGMMAVEEQSLTWTIDNFSVIGKQKSLIDLQKIHFSAGTSVGHPSKWSIYLEESTVNSWKRWIGIFFRVEEPSASDPIWKNVFAEMEFVFEGPHPIHRNTGQKEVAAHKRGFGFNQWIPAESTPERLVIKFTFKLYVPSKSTEACQPTLEELQAKFTTQAKKDLLDVLLKNPIPGRKIKIISKDKKKFFVQKEILEAHSPILKAMMKNDKLEANSRGIKFSDISSKGLEVILTFLNTGEFHPAWSDPKVLVGLINAAAKYQLQDLLKFLDASLGKICKKENVLALYKLAQEHSLKKAEVELLKFINEKGFSSPDLFLPKEKSFWGRF